MTRLIWDKRSERFYETGVDRGVLYPITGNGVAWNGLISVEESPSGGEAKPYYFDGDKYLNISAAEEFEATITAYSCPTEFGVSDGISEIHNGLYATQQPRKSFSFSYRSLIGNDVDGSDHGYKIHLIYNALAAPSQRNNNTIGDSSGVLQLSWKITTLPPAIQPGYKRTSHFVVDSRYADPEVLSSLEDLLYGTDADAPSLPTVAALIDLFAGEIGGA